MATLKANAQLQAELKNALLQLKKQPLNSPQVTPPPRRAAASPPVSTSSTSASAGKSKGVNKKVPDTGDSSDGEEDNPSEEARLHRLRRVCERKPSGRLNVPEHIHLQWLKGDRTTRLKMLDVLESASWNKDLMVLWCVLEILMKSYEYNEQFLMCLYHYSLTTWYPTVLGGICEDDCLPLQAEEDSKAGKDQTWLVYPGRHEGNLEVV